ncbi:MbtH family NRPS accessory protein [Micromonospora sp. WMMD998]|uniref:MbtH family protein n=1 Tax=Micromonospora sp. WMMD998 TaxID=3016092 RepID=UPI002499BFA5|nr:MbtH family NRPS accessory protein [Micromonospora sp. WMMD998]WFE41011.1 MbtH family NRPS accessory protein [Micromonospora sp. WMMD998]
MTQHESPTDRSFLVVVNHEEQYSVWAADRQVPDGWRAEGFAGTREQCLDHVERIWTDMRPLSLRRRMAEQDS